MQRIPYEGETYSVVVGTIYNGVEITVCNTCDIHSTPICPNRNFSTIIATPPNWFWRWMDETYENRIESAIQHLTKQIVKVDKSRMKADCKHTTIYNQSKEILKKYKSV